MDSKHITPRVFLFPWLSYGHISPYLELAKKLTNEGYYVYLFNTPINLEKISRKCSLYGSIQLVEFHLPSLPDLPPENHTTNGLPSHLKATFRKAIEMAKPSLSNVLKTLNPDLIIYDSLLEWVPTIASQQDIPMVTFFPGSAIFISYFFHVTKSPDIDQFPFPTFHLGKFDRDNYMDGLIGFSPSKKTTTEGADKKTPPIFALIKTSRAMEGIYIDYLQKFIKTKFIPLGNLVPEPAVLDDQGENIETMEWLGKKNERSSVLVSFGSEILLRKEEIEEIAAGLELSEVNFIWVIRVDPGEEKATLLEDIHKRIAEKGRIIEGWAPQEHILKHPSIGGFVSHCGWSSTLESLEFEVPLIAMPVHLDQPLNAKLVMELGIGLEVIKDENGKFHRDDIANVIKDVIIGDKGEGIRKQLGIIRGEVKMREKEEMDEAFQMLAQIFEKNMDNPHMVLDS